jgi:hypothetical protein
VASGFLDATGDDLFTKAAADLRMPLFELLAVRPVLTLPAWATDEADRFLARFTASSFVGVCFAGSEPETLRSFQSRIVDAIGLALGAPHAVALNFFTTGYAFPHRPAADRARLEHDARESSPLLAGLSRLDARVVPCADLPIELVAALLRRCRYFVGSDNGIKHLAWVLDIPRTFFVTARPHRLDVMRWMPDVHRMLPFDCPRRTSAPARGPRVIAESRRRCYSPCADRPLYLCLTSNEDRVGMTGDLQPRRRQ